MIICKATECMGCFACKNICPVNAIAVGHDAMDKTIPIIDENTCLNCGMCRKVCPVNTQMEYKRADAAYASWSKMITDKENSSSGGMAAVFSRKIIEQGGCVFASAGIDGTVKHKKAITENECEQFRGSKYVQSDIGESYKEAKEELDSGKKVLFVGTPCQIAGLKSFLQKDYANLVTVDLICHGTPPVKYLQAHIQSKTGSSNWDKVSFRGKYDWHLQVIQNGRVEYDEYRDSDLYFQSFLDALTYRDNCYECKYARPERVSDITIGDFWGLNRSNLENAYDGRISLVFPNTKKGKEFFEDCQDKLVCEKRPFEEAICPEQWNLQHPSKIHLEREKFEKYYLQFGFDDAVKRTSIGKSVLKRKIKNKIKCNVLVKMIRKR